MRLVQSMIITVHDELIMEVPEDHIKEGAELLVGTMKRVGHTYSVEYYQYSL